MKKAARLAMLLERMLDDQDGDGDVDFDDVYSKVFDRNHDGYVTSMEQLQSTAILLVILLLSCGVLFLGWKVHTLSKLVQGEASTRRWSAIRRYVHLAYKTTNAQQAHKRSASAPTAAAASGLSESASHGNAPGVDARGRAKPCSASAPAGAHSHEHCNWLRVAFALRILCKAVAPYAERQAIVAQRRNVAHFASRSPPIACEHGKGDTYDPKRSPCASCDAMVAHFATLHKGWGKARAPKLNTRGGKKEPYSCARWGSASPEGAWDVAKLFSKLPSPSSSAYDADLTALVNILLNYEAAFHMKDTKSIGTWIQRAVEVRNETMHQGSLELDDDKATDSVEVVRRTLLDFQAHHSSEFPDAFAAALDELGTMVKGGDAYFHGQEADRDRVLQEQKMAAMERQLEEQAEMSESFRRRLERLESKSNIDLASDAVEHE